ncbi:hypothetical protein AA313_de0202053 [Arthrobotrys entomopaga]|nr:hypothetical protein AA313_de0202053 [Arthrobotrys entomopaga]
MAGPPEDSSRDDKDLEKEPFGEDDFDDESEESESEASLEGYVGVAGSSSCKGQPAPTLTAPLLTVPAASSGGDALTGGPPNTATDSQSTGLTGRSLQIELGGQPTLYSAGNYHSGSLALVGMAFTTPLLVTTSAPAPVLAQPLPPMALSPRAGATISVPRVVDADGDTVMPDFDPDTEMLDAPSSRRRGTRGIPAPRRDTPTLRVYWHLPGRQPWRAGERVAKARAARQQM